MKPASGIYRVFFTDKGAIPESVSPEQILSPAAIARREKYGIPFPDEADLPVSGQYISAVEQRRTEIQMRIKVDEHGSVYFTVARKF